MQADRAPVENPVPYAGSEPLAPSCTGDRGLVFGPPMLGAALQQRSDQLSRRVGRLRRRMEEHLRRAAQAQRLRDQAGTQRDAVRSRLHEIWREEDLRPVHPGPSEVVFPDCVYFARAQDGAIKIGHSRYPEIRVSTFRRERNCGVELLKVIPCCSTSEAVRLERACHQRHAAARLTGEWFSPTPELLAEARS